MRLISITYFFITIFLFYFNNISLSQEISDLGKGYTLKNPEGTEFWLCFMKNYRTEGNDDRNELILELFITSNENTEVNIEIKNINFRTKLFIPGGTVNNVKIPPEAQIQSNEIIERNAAVKITSVKPISVYGLNRRHQTTDTYLGLPKRVLGKEYRVVGYSISEGFVSQFAIVGTEDSTKVTIIPSFPTARYQSYKPHSVIINAGDVYQVAAKVDFSQKCDLTGSLIVSDKPVAVFSGHQCAYVPERVQACNHLVEQIPPVHSWGKHFYLGKLEQRSKYTYRVVAHEPETKVFQDNILVKVLGQGEYFERTENKNIQVTADKPILVAQYSQGFKNGDSIGDPMMLLISPTQQFLKQYRFATPVNGFWNHYVNLIVPTNALNTLKLNGRIVEQAKDFQQIGLSRYSAGSIKIPFGTYVIDCAMPFGMYSYGFGYSSDSYDAYGTMGGQSFLEYEPANDTLPPTGEMMIVSNSEIKIIIRDDRVDDSGINDIKVIFSDGLNAEIPKIIAGTPQVAFKVNVKYPDKEARLIFTATDVNLNTATFNICYLYDARTESFIFSFIEGDNEKCHLDPGFQIGAFVKLSAIFHNADFITTDGLTANGKFSDAFGISGIGGFLFGRRYLYDFTFSARLSFQNYSGTLSAPDAEISHVRDVTGALLPFQQAYEMRLNGTFMHLDLATEWYLKKYLYLLGGINFALNLSRSIDVYNKILIPDNYYYPNGSRVKIAENTPKTLSSINFLRFGAFGGLGVTHPINYQISVFMEAIYNIHFGNLIDDGKWGINQLALQFGLKYRI